MPLSGLRRKEQGGRETKYRWKSRNGTKTGPAWGGINYWNEKGKKRTLWDCFDLVSSCHWGSWLGVLWCASVCPLIRRTTDSILMYDWGITFRDVPENPWVSGLTILGGGWTFQRFLQGVVQETPSLFRVLFGQQVLPTALSTVIEFGKLYRVLRRGKILIFAATAEGNETFIATERTRDWLKCHAPHSCRNTFQMSWLWQVVWWKFNCSVGNKEICAGVMFLFNQCDRGGRIVWTPLPSHWLRNVLPGDRVVTRNGGGFCPSSLCCALWEAHC